MNEYPDDYGITADALVRIRATLKSGSEPEEGLLRLAAMSYWHFADRRGTGRGIKADLLALARNASAARDSLVLLSPLIWVATMVANENSSNPIDVHVFGRLEEDLADLIGAAERAALMDLRALSQRTPFHLAYALSLVGGAYKRATGLPITHSANKDGEYVGEALSPFGQFATAFFAEVDPSVHPRKIANAIRRDLAALNS